MYAHPLTYQVRVEAHHDQGLSPQEESWRSTRGKQVMTALQDYLNTANISDFDIQGYMDKLNESTVPIVGMSISGGGTQSGIGGLGVWQAYDARYPAAVAAGTGGLTQILSYITGLSGGGAVTVSLMYALLLRVEYWQPPS